jgi:ubiquinone/menaquinone biosynthesis C-methylase UbiE
MAKELNPRITEYFARNDAAAQWWNVDYRTGGRYRKQIEFIHNTLDLRGLKTLDVATGLARFAIDFVKHGAQEVTAIDISPSMIERANDNAKQHSVADKIDFKVGDAATLNLKTDYYDVASLMEVLVHLPDPKSVICSMTKYIKPGGYFITNYDLPHAPKVTYPLDWIWGWARGIVKNRFKKDVVMYNTVDETIKALDKSKGSSRVTRPKDAYRGIPMKEVNQMLSDCGLKAVHVLKERVSFANITLPITIGYMVIAQKQ